MICKSNDGAVGGVENSLARQSAIGEKNVATQVAKANWPDGRLLASKAKDTAPRQSAIGEKSLVTEMQGKIDLAQWLPASLAEKAGA